MLVLLAVPSLCGQTDRQTLGIPAPRLQRQLSLRPAPGLTALDTASRHTHHHDFLPSSSPPDLLPQPRRQPAVLRGTLLPDASLPQDLRLWRAALLGDRPGWWIVLPGTPGVSSNLPLPPRSVRSLEEEGVARGGRGGQPGSAPPRQGVCWMAGQGGLTATPALTRSTSGGGGRGSVSTTTFLCPHST